MNIREVSNQFTIYVATNDVHQGPQLKVALAEAGYDAQFFQDEQSICEGVRQSPPHLVLFFSRQLTGSLNEFVGQTLEMNADVHFIVLASLQQFEILAQYNSIGVLDILSDDPVNLETRILWAVDRCCERLLLTFQNEQMLEDLNGKAQQNKDLKRNLNEVDQQLGAQRHANQIPISSRLADYKLASSREDLIAKFQLHLPGVESVFYKYLPNIRSLIAIHSSGPNIPQQLQQIHHISEADLRSIATQAAAGEIPETLKQPLSQLFLGAGHKVWPLFSHLGLEGLFAFRFDKEMQDLLIVAEEFALFQTAYNIVMLEKRVHELEVQDPLTGLYNRAFFLKRLPEEMARSRRTFQPLSLIKMAMDDFLELGSSLGEQTRDEIFKKVGAAILSSSRSHDLICRVGENEISILLPAVDKKGAIYRAERLRRQLERENAMREGLKISVSMGISEYPTLSRNAEELDRSATKAMMHVYDKGGNRICMYKPPNDHVPEFVVQTE